MQILKLENVSVNLNGNEILSGISLEIPEKKITTLIGPSGAGKTTLLRLFNRLVSPTEGRVVFRGENLEQIDVIQLRNKVGMVFQAPALFPGTVLSNVTYGPRLRGIREDEHALYCLDLAGLDRSFANRDVNSLSGGEQQRVSIARTLANKPEILLLDEPTSALDPVNTVHFEKIVQELKSRLELTIVWVTHNLSQAQRISDYTVFLVQGKIIETGINGQLFSNPGQETTKLFLAGRLAEEKGDKL